MRITWTHDKIVRAVAVVCESPDMAEAARTLSGEFGAPVSSNSLQMRLRKAYRQGVIAEMPNEYVGRFIGQLDEPSAIAPMPPPKRPPKKQASPARREQPRDGAGNLILSGHSAPVAAATVSISDPFCPIGPPAGAGPEPDEHMEVVRAVRRGAKTMTDLANKLDVSPRTAQARVDAAIAAGITLDFTAAGELVFELPKAEVSHVHGVPRDGKWTKLAVMSDLHIGSAHCFEDEIGDFVTRAHGDGYTTVLIPGDLLEGALNHRGFEYEVKAAGFDAQVALLFDVLPALPGLTYHFCVGNHEVNSFWKSIGMRPDIAIGKRAAANGRPDIIASGAMLKGMESAYMLLNPGDPETEIKVELSHTYDRKAYAISYPLQKHVEGIQPGSKPHVLLKGHLHCFSCLDIRGIVCLQPCCFKGQGAWERSKAMTPTVGGVLLDVRHNGQAFDFRAWPQILRPAPQTWIATGLESPDA